MGRLAFGATLWTCHVIYIVILRVFFGASGKSSLGADVMIFGMMLGLLFAFGGSLGYFISSAVFRALQSSHLSLRHEAVSAMAAALVAYLLAMSSLSYVSEYLEHLGVFDVNGYGMAIAPWTLLAMPSALLVLIVAKSGTERNFFRSD